MQNKKKKHGHALGSLLEAKNIQQNFNMLYTQGYNIPLYNIVWAYMNFQNHGIIKS